MCKILETKEIVCKIFKTLELWFLWSFGRHKPEAGGFCLDLGQLYAGCQAEDLLRPRPIARSPRPGYVGARCARRTWLAVKTPGAPSLSPSFGDRVGRGQPTH